jgi:catechol 2,3-dioxygenase-like lactoylglutathione lyase family enzyme
MKSQGSSGAALHHVSLRVANLERSIAFYRDGLGLTLGSAFESQGRRFALMVAPRGGRVELVETQAAARRPTEHDVLWHLALETDDAQAAFDTAVAAGGQVAVPVTALDLVDEVTNRPWRVRIAFVRGPDAEEVELIEESDG